MANKESYVLDGADWDPKISAMQKVGASVSFFEAQEYNNQYPVIEAVSNSHNTVDSNNAATFYGSERLSIRPTCGTASADEPASLHSGLF